MSKGGSVLVVESHTDTRELYAVALTMFGFDVVTAIDGPDAFAKARIAAPAVVVSGMPLAQQGSESELCRWFSDRGIPVIVVTGFDPGPEHEAVRSQGCAAVLMKPLDPKTLATCINSVLGSTCPRTDHHG